MMETLILTHLYFLGSVRRQVHLATLFLGAILFMLPAYINAFSLGINAFERVSKDFGLTLIGYFGIAMAILLASTSIPRDLENRSIYPVLARPVRRYQYLLAHYLALVALLACSYLFLGVCLSAAVSALTHELDLTLFRSLHCRKPCTSRYRWRLRLSGGKPARRIHSVLFGGRPRQPVRSRSGHGLEVCPAESGGLLSQGSHSPSHPLQS